MKITTKGWRIIGIGALLSVLVTGELIFHYRDQHIKRAEAAVFIHDAFTGYFGKIAYIVRRKTASRSTSLISPRKSGQFTYFVSGSRASGELTLFWEYQTDTGKWEVRNAIVNGKTMESQFPIKITDHMVDSSELVTRQGQWWPSHRRVMVQQDDN